MRPLPPRETVVVRGAWVLTLAEDGTLEDGAVSMENGAITDIGP